MAEYIRLSDEIIRDFADANGFVPVSAVDIARKWVETRNHDFYNPLIQAGYRALAAGANMQILWNDAHGYLVDPYPGQKVFNRIWKTFEKYDAKYFDSYVAGFNDHFRKYTREALRGMIEADQVDFGGWEDH